MQDKTAQEESVPRDQVPYDAGPGDAPANRVGTDHSPARSEDASPEIRVGSVPARLVVKRAEVRVRRAPRYGRFIGGTIGLFIVVSFFSAYVTPVGGDYTRSQVFGYLVLASIALGLPVGSVVALVLDRLLARSARTVVAEQTGVHEADVAPEPGRESTGVRPPEHDQAHDPQSNENE